MVSFGHEQNSICSQKHLNDIAHEHTIICRSRGGLSANEKEETFASNDNLCWFPSIINSVLMNTSIINLVPRFSLLPIKRPWLGLVLCLPESGRLQTNGLEEGQISVRFVSSECRLCL